MQLRVPRRPLAGALLLFASLAAMPGSNSAAAESTPPPALASPPGSSAPSLQVYGVADRLIGFLEAAIGWIDTPATRTSLASLKPGIRAAVLAHPEVRLASEQRQTAEYSTREAFAAYLPQVSANADAGGRRHFDAVNKPWSVVPAHEDNSRSYGFTARQLLFDFGGVGGRVDAQSARETAAEARSASRRSELTLKAVTVWHEMFRAEQGLKLAQVNRHSRQQITQFIEERERLGGSSKSDVLRARARLSDAQAALAVAENRLKIAEASYREIFNTAPPIGVALPEALTLDPTRYADLDKLIRQNPLFAEALAQSEAAGHDAKAAAASMYPSVHFEVSATRRDVGGIGTPGTDTNAGVVLRHNFYSGGADSARRSQAEQKSIEARLELDGLRRQLERALAQTQADVRNSSTILTTRKESVQVASAALESVREQFAFRRGTLLDLLRAQEELYIAGRDLIDGIVDHALVRYRLLHLAMELTPLFEIEAASTEPRNN